MEAKLILIACFAMGAALGAPQYNYEIPPAPSNLYETPAESVQEPVQLYETPEETVQEPVQLYLAPSDNLLVAEPQNVVPNVVSPPPIPTPGPMEGMPYDFTWGVEDPESGNTFSHVENSDGQTMQGEYRVLLPDGRLQVVRFFDNGGGFNAEVTYEK